MLERVINLAATITEIGWVLKPGGWFCFDTTNRTARSRWMMIWLLKNLLRQIPQEVHDWQKFVPPTDLRVWLEQSGFGDVALHGFDLFGRSAIAYISNLLYYWRTHDFRVQFDDNTDVRYIGTVAKTGLSDRHPTL